MKRFRRWLMAAPMAALLVAGGAYAIASYDWCGRWPAEPPRLVSEGLAEGPLRAGAAKVELQPPYPVVAAGYGPPRAKAQSAEQPLHARALVLEVGEVRVGLLSFDLLSVTAELEDAVRDRARGLALDELWVSATHAHSSMGGYDRRWVAQLAGTGRYRGDSFRALADAGARALDAAVKSLAAAELGGFRGSLAGEVEARSGEEVDDRLTLLRVTRAGQPVASVWVASPHPTLRPRRAAALHPDYPGALALAEEAGGAGVLLFMVGAGGNARPSGAPSPEAYAARLQEAGAQAEAVPSEGSVALGFRRVAFSLPRPDASRLVPSFSRRAGDNFLCESSPHASRALALRLGPVTLLGVPFEVTAGAARDLLSGDGSGERVVGLTHDYLGYLETAPRVSAGEGEARRQYYGVALAQEVSRALRLARAFSAATP